MPAFALIIPTLCFSMAEFQQLVTVLIFVSFVKYIFASGKISFAEKSTFAHNYVRALHRVNGLEWDDVLAREAQTYSRLLATKNSVERSPGSVEGLYGENIYKGFSWLKNAPASLKLTTSIAEAVLFWYYEINGYHFNNETPHPSKHAQFTQLIWKDTRKVGCGFSPVDEYGGIMTYIVCRYQPKGNTPGLFQKNVPEISKTESIPQSLDELEAATGCVDSYDECEQWKAICMQQPFRKLMMSNCRKTCNIC